MGPSTCLNSEHSKRATVCERCQGIGDGGWREERSVLEQLVRFNLYPAVPKTLLFRKPFGTKSTITFHAALYNRHGLPSIPCSAITLQHMFCNLIVCKEGRCWRARRARNNDEFCALSGKSGCDISHKAANTIKHSLRPPLSFRL